MESGLLDRRESFDLLDNLDFGIMELGMSDEEPAENVSVEPVPIPDGNESVGAQGTVSPPPLPTTASTADEMTPGVDSGVSALRNSVKNEPVEAAPVSSVGGDEKVSTQDGGSDGVQGQGQALSVGNGGYGGGQNGGSGEQEGEQELDVSIFPVCFFAV